MTVYRCHEDIKFTVKYFKAVQLVVVYEQNLSKTRNHSYCTSFPSQITVKKKTTSWRLHPRGLGALALLLSISWHIPPLFSSSYLFLSFFHLVSRGLITGGRLRGWGGARRTGISVTLEEKPSDSGLNNDKSPWAELQIQPPPHWSL